MKRKPLNGIGIGPDAAPAGPKGRPGPSEASRPSIPIAIIYDRALAWHRIHLGKGCDCVDTKEYPCVECRREVCELVDLLDATVRDTIRVVTTALERMT